MFLIVSPFKNLFPHDLFIYLIIYMKKIVQFIILKTPPHLVRLLGKIYALSKEVLDKRLAQHFVYEFGIVTGRKSFWRAG